jgi:hypothetical protein
MSIISHTNRLVAKIVELAKQVKPIVFVFIFSSGILCAQDKNFATIPPTDAIRRYFSETKEYAALFNGKIETPYERPFVNHPYLGTDQYVQGTLCYNDVVYQDIYMRLDVMSALTLNQS